MKKVLSLICLVLSTVINAQTETNWFSDTTICNGDTIEINFPDGDFADYTNFNWTFNEVVISVDSTINIHQNGTYMLTLHGADTVYSSFDLTLDLNEFVLTTTDSDNNVDSVLYLCLEDDPTLITPSANEGYPHTWYLNGLALDDSLSERSLTLENIIDEIEFDQEFDYTVMVDNACGRIESKNIVTIVLNECNCALDMPNVFTPNGDDINSVFKPLNNHELETEAERICESTNFQMEIYSQWGRHMTTVLSEDEYPSWDGLNNRGTEVPEGVYFYRIVYNVNVYTLPEEKEITGFFHLYR